MRILVVSNTPWSRSNSFGSTYDTIFGEMPDIQISSIYCNVGKPDSGAVDRALQVTTESLVHSMISPRTPSAAEVDDSPGVAAPVTSRSHVSRLQGILSSLRRQRFSFYGLAGFAQFVIWLVGPWRSTQLRNFVEQVKPDLVFLPLYHLPHMSRMALHVMRIAQVPVVAYVSDDIYSLRQFSVSPFYWMQRLVNRRLLREIVSQCPWIYVVSEVQRREYSKLLGVECRILTKLGRFVDAEQPRERVRTVTDGVVFTYAGNVGNGRWKSLAEIGKAVSQANRGGNQARLDIYTMTPLSRRMRRALTQIDCVTVHRAVPPEELDRIYYASDVLVLAEPLDRGGRLRVRQSLSTKVVEYIQSGRAILARGTREMATLQHLNAHCAAVVSTPDDDLEAQVLRLIADPALRRKLALQGWRLGVKSHDQGTISADIRRELQTLITEA